MFSTTVLELDPVAETGRIVAGIRNQVFATLRKRGAVLGLSGGVDSSVVAALCVRALGRDKLLALMMPEHHSADESLTLGRKVAASLGAAAIVEDIGSIL
jgi:NAD+ synthase